jgi:hypothetical protein
VLDGSERPRADPLLRSAMPPRTARFELDTNSASAVRLDVREDEESARAHPSPHEMGESTISPMGMPFRHRTTKGGSQWSSGKKGMCAHSAAVN